MPKKARKPPPEIRKQDISKKRRGNLPQKSESRTYAKKGEETSHRNPKAGHMQKKARKPPTEIRKRDIIRKKICICPNKRKMWDIVERKSSICPNKRKMWDIVERKSSICPTSYLSLPEIKFE